MNRFRKFGAMVVLGVTGVAFAQAPPETAPQPAPQPPEQTAPSAVQGQPAVAAPGQKPTISATSGQDASSPNYAGPMDATRYIIGPEDSLQITVWKEPTLSGTFPVRPDGMISLVLVGDMPAAGQTPMVLSNEIATRLKKYVQDPVVTVVVLGVNSQRIFMVGEVGHVGPIMLTPGMTPLQAIVTAGGLSQFANSKKIYILRNVGGKQQKIPFNYKAAVKGIDEGVSLLPGDTIIVP